MSERETPETAAPSSTAAWIGDHLPGAVIYQAVLHPDGRITPTYVSAGIRELTGVSAEEALTDADTLVDLIHPADRERFLAAAWQSAATLEPFDVSVRQHTRDGELRWMYYRSTPRRLPDGTTCWDGVQLDVTERARAYEALRSASESAAAESRAKDELLAVVSHELRGPLAPALTLAHALALSPGLTAEQREYAVAISRWIDVELRLIDDLVDHERIAHGVLRLRPSRIDAHGPIRHALTACEAPRRVKQLQLVERLDAADPWVLADPLRVQQIVWNLLRNAIAFTPPSGHVWVHTQTASDALELVVEDDGEGIDPAMLERIFEPFERGGRESVPRGGLGVGLTLARQLAEAHGGTLSAYSRGQGRGARFMLRLPRGLPR